MKRCSHCARPMDMSGAPPTIEQWDSDECEAAWYAARPHEARKWTPISSMTLEQIALVRADLGLGEKT